MPQDERRSLWDAIYSGRDAAQRFLSGSEGAVCLRDLAHSSSLGGPVDRFRGQSVLVATAGQFTAALALIELDGVARRLVVCPPDLAPEHFSWVKAQAGIEAVVSDRPDLGEAISVSPKLRPAEPNRIPEFQTEWVLFTSGTTGRPKMVVHTLASLAGAIGRAGGVTPIWSTFYDIRRYGGLQIFLRAMLGGGSLVLAGAGESTADFLARAATHGVTHISGTPSHWRRALMTAAARAIAPQYVRLSGEIADQAILDHLRVAYPDAAVAHAFATTEAGVAFAVNDGLAGFPSSFVGQPGPVEMKVEDGSLRIRSPRTASRYLGDGSGPLKDADDFVDTRDMVELRGPLLVRRPARRRHQCRRSESSSRGGRSRDQPASGRADVAGPDPKKSDHRRAGGGGCGFEERRRGARGDGARNPAPLPRDASPPQGSGSPGLYFSHTGGIWVSPHAVIGSNCDIAQQVTIGCSAMGRTGAPQLGNNVYVGTGATIIGQIKIGDGAKIGANTLVMSNVPPGATVVGVPGRVVMQVPAGGNKISE